jgi:hypothetical protein
MQLFFFQSYFALELMSSTIYKSIHILFYIYDKTNYENIQILQDFIT